MSQNLKMNFKLPCFSTAGEGVSLSDLLPSKADDAGSVRDTQIADGIRRGVSTFVSKGLGAVSLAEFSLANDRRADLMVLLPDGSFWLIEIKSSRQDFLSDSKWQSYLEYCDWYSFAVSPEFPIELLPDDEGLILADAFGAEVMRPAQSRKMSAARRKAVTTRFARTAAKRLEHLTLKGGNSD
ncbi:MAG: MmcB family DNA repair protein [Alphaproteobacteria bacterium]